MSSHPPEMYDVFLSHSHEDSSIVEYLATVLEDDASFRVWLDKWILIPGTLWQQEMARGLEEARTCVVCIGSKTPAGWFQQEIQKALNRQSKDPTFRVIPVILPGGDSTFVENFLELRTWVDFNDGLDDERAMHLLVSGVAGKPPGRYLHKLSDIDLTRHRLGMVRRFRNEGLIDQEVAIEYQRRLLDRLVSD